MRTRSARIKAALPETTLSGLAILAISSGIALMGSEETQFIGVCLVVVGIALLLLGNYVGIE